MKYRKLLALMLGIFLILSSFTGCKKEAAEESQETSTQESTVSNTSQGTLEASGSQNSSETSSASNESTSESSEESSKEPEPAGPVLISDPNMNPLTGEILDHVVSNKRPVAFTIDNHPFAIPAVGVGEADIIFEGIIEGGATRMLAIFQELPDDIVIGGSRSLRHSFIDFAACFDAIIAHCGCSNLAQDALARRGYDDIDALLNGGHLFYRDPWRLANLEYVHSLVTTGEAINDYLENDAPFRTEHEGYTCNMTFTETPVVVGGNLMTDIDIFFGDYVHAIFTFDPLTNDYTFKENDVTYYDYATGEAVRFKNLVVIRTDVWVCDGVHQDMALTGEGDGYFMVNGAMAPIKWTRETEDSQFVLTYEDGSPVIVGVGTTYIAVVNEYGGVSAYEE